MTILNTYTTSFPIIVYIIGVVIFGGFLFTMAYCEEKSIALGLIASITTIAIITTILIVGGIFKPHVRVEATIDDNVSFNEVYEKYEVINKEGQIYTLEPRAKDDN